MDSNSEPSYGETQIFAIRFFGLAVRTFPKRWQLPGRSKAVDTSRLTPYATSVFSGAVEAVPSTSFSFSCDTREMDNTVMSSS